MLYWTTMLMSAMAEVVVVVVNLLVLLTEPRQMKLISQLQLE